MLDSRLSRKVRVGNCQKLQSGRNWKSAKYLTKYSTLPMAISTQATPQLSK